MLLAAEGQHRDDGPSSYRADRLAASSPRLPVQSQAAAEGQLDRRRRLGGIGPGAGGAGKGSGRIGAVDNIGRADSRHGGAGSEGAILTLGVDDGRADAGAPEWGQRQ